MTLEGEESRWARLEWKLAEVEDKNEQLHIWRAK